MVPPPETIRINSRRVACDGSGGPNGVPPALGHPRVWLEIDDGGSADCSYCDRRFILIGGAADSAPDAHAVAGAGEGARQNMAGDIEAADEDSLGR